jgi:hypothetical protein
MTTAGETLQCANGEMQLSQRLFRGLMECYVENTRCPKDLTFIYNGKPQAIGGKWFCPACGVEIKEEKAGVLKCPKCSKSLVGFIYDLIERHPHKDADGVLSAEKKEPSPRPP